MKFGAFFPSELQFAAVLDGKCIVNCFSQNLDCAAGTLSIALIIANIPLANAQSTKRVDKYSRARNLQICLKFTVSLEASPPVLPDR